MHIQELETERHGIKLLICVLNDGAYGAEIHKLRQDGLDDSGAIFGRTDFGSISKGFGLRGANVTDLSQFSALCATTRRRATPRSGTSRSPTRVASPSTRRGRW